MPTGTVKWFNNAKGFGFILPEDGGEDLFAHFSAIDMNGYKTLKAGQAVEFGVIKGDKGLHATSIRIADEIGAQEELTPSIEKTDESTIEEPTQPLEHA